MSEIKLLSGFSTEAEALKRSETAWKARLAAKHAAGKRLEPKAAPGDVTKFLGRVRQKADKTEWALEIRPTDEILLTTEEKEALVIDNEDWQAEDNMEPLKEVNQ